MKGRGGKVKEIRYQTCIFYHLLICSFTFYVFFSFYPFKLNSFHFISMYFIIGCWAFENRGISNSSAAAMRDLLMGSPVLRNLLLHVNSTGR